MDRIGVAVAPSDPNIVYVLSETKTEGELWRSDDAGAPWRTVNRDPNINFRPFYYADIRVDPKNPNRVFTLSGGLYFSEDGGPNFRTIARTCTVTIRRCGSTRWTRATSSRAATAAGR